MKRLVPILLLASCGIAQAVEPTVSGKWAVHSSIAGSELDQTCTFTQDAKTLSGTCVNDDKTSVKITGTADGSKVTWTYNSEYNGTPLTLRYTGTLAAGKIVGNANVDPFDVGGDFTATLVK